MIADPPNLAEAEPLADPLDIPAIRHTARALLDRAKDAADRDNPDRRYTMPVPSWGGAVVTLRALSFAEVTRMQLAAEGDVLQQARLLVGLVIVDPPFSPKEVAELFDDPDQLDATLLLTNAAEQINKFGQRGQAVAALSFRTGQSV